MIKFLRENVYWKTIGLYQRYIKKETGAVVGQTLMIRRPAK